MDANEIRGAIATGRWAITNHAREQAGKRQITDDELTQLLVAGEILEDYPGDPRGPSALFLGYTPANRPLHAVCAFDPSGTLLIITMYEPEMPWWADERTRNPSREPE